MSAIHITLDADDARSALSRIIAAARDPGPAFAVLGPELVASVRRRFELGQAPDGTAWTPTRTGGRPLVRTGRLRDSIQAAAGADAGGDGAGTLAVGTDVPYAPVHQVGGRFIPARPFIGTDAADRDRITAGLSDHLLAALTGAG